MGKTSNTEPDFDKFPETGDPAPEDIEFHPHLLHGSKQGVGATGHGRNIQCLGSRV